MCKNIGHWQKLLKFSSGVEAFCNFGCFGIVCTEWNWICKLLDMKFRYNKNLPSVSGESCHEKQVAVGGSDIYVDSIKIWGNVCPRSGRLCVYHWQCIY